MMNNDRPPRDDGTPPDEIAVEGAEVRAERTGAEHIGDAAQPNTEASEYDGAEEYEEYEDDPDEGMVRVRRPLFLTMVFGGVAAILALGAATTWLALDRNKANNPVVATVNGDTIRRSEYDKAVAAQSGAEVLDNLVTEKLVAGEAKKRNIVVTDEQVNTLLSEQKTRIGGDQAYQAALAQAGLTEPDLLKQLRLSEALRQMVAEKITVTQEEVDQQFAAAGERVAGQPPEQAKEQIRTQIKQQKEGTAVRALLDQLRAEAKIETSLPGKQL